MNAASLLLYNLGIRLYWVGIWLASAFNTKAKQWIAGRVNWQQKIDIPTTKGKRVWFHCASLGEFEQARPVIEKWGCKHPDDYIVLTFFSPSGYEIRKNYEGADVVMYLPLDTAANAKQFIELVKPDVALFVKYEYWYHFLNELKNKNVPVILFSAIFRNEQVFFKWYGGLYHTMLTMFSSIFVQNEESKQLLHTIGIDSKVCPDTRFDRVHEIAQNKKSFPLIEKFAAGNKILVAGSTWRKDEEMLIPIIKQKVLQGYKYIIAPHNITKQNIDYLVKNISVPTQLLSQLTEANAKDTQVIIVDSIGQLAMLYAYGSIAYIGGGFNTSVHNILEAAVYGMPVVFGPNYTKSAEAIDLIQLSSAYTCISQEQLITLLKGLSGNVNNSATKAALEGTNYINTHLGGKEIICTEIISYFS